MTATLRRIRSVFVDTSAFYAIADQADNSHTQARAIQQRLTTDRTPLLTSNLIVAESYSLFLSRGGIKPALAFLSGLEQGSMVVIRVTVADETRARAIVRQYDDKDFSLVDATSFAIMERLGLEDAFTFDRHFVQYGFRMVGP
jgi:predicted nucleic acid-binding protein